MRYRLASVAFTLFLVSGLSPVQAQNNILFILDASNSMWGRVDERPKMEVAKEVLSDLIRSLPDETSVGLMTYGHRVKDACDDIEVIAPIGGTDAEGLAGSFSSITPLGKTPIAGALRASADALEGRLEETNNVVLVSDGVETCEGDPCAEASVLHKMGINTRVHVVGFDVSEAEAEQLQCIAEGGGGQYYTASNTQGLTDALAEVKKVVEAAPPPPPEPAPVAASGPLFIDEFDGDEPADHWEILNEDLDAYIVEAGELLLIGAGEGTLANGNVPNIFRLKQDMPEGDWVATVRFKMPYQTGREAPFIAIYDDHDNHIATTSNAWSYYEKIRGARMFITSWKETGGETTSFNTVIWGGASGEAFSADQAPNPIQLRITKKGRTYTPAVLLEGEAGSTWIEHESLTALRVRGRLAIGIYQAEKVDGETPMMVDWVKIEAAP